MPKAPTTQRKQYPNVTWYDPTAARSQSSAIRKIIRLQPSSLVSEVLMVKKNFFAALLLLLLISVPVFSQKNRSERFDPDGSFWLQGQPPNDFSDFGAINLNAKRSRQLPQPGLETNNGK